MSLRSSSEMSTQRDHFPVTLFISLLLVVNHGQINSATADDSLAPVKISSIDSKVLLAFKKKLTDPQSSLVGWDTSLLCNGENAWYGVTCDTSGRVIELKLTQLSLSGPFVANSSLSAGGLKLTQRIDFSDNSFGGGFPTFLSSLPALNHLDLSKNNLTGSIPAWISKLLSLEQLILYSNNFQGDLPTQLGSLQNLLYLDLSQNSVFNGIPTELGQLSSLRDLRLSSCNIPGAVPSELGDITSLQILDLSWNQLSGEIPTSLGNLEKLEYLFLQQNQLTGGIPAEFQNLRLWALDLSGNSLSGSIPSELTSITTLGTLDLHKNELTGTLPDGMSNWESLQYMDLSGNQLSEGLYSTLNDLKSLTFLDLNSNQFSGQIPDLSNLQNLTTLVLSSNSLQGAIPETLSSLQSLVYLGLSSNSLSGRLPASLGSLPILQTLLLQNNFLTGVLPSSFVSTSFSTLDIAGNYLSGAPEVYLEGDSSPLSERSNFGYSFKDNCMAYRTCEDCDNVQRRAEDCVAFCDATQALGACAGGGDCSVDDSGSASCACDEGLIPSASGTMCITPVVRATGVTYPRITKPRFMSRNFRHMSATHLNSSRGDPRWSVAYFWDWREELSQWDVRDQGECFGCWAYAVTAAVESAIAITFALKTPPTLSEAQILKCGGSGGCSGGWTGDALEYAAEYPLLTSSGYKGTCPSKTAAGGYRVSHYEQVNFIGWFGLLLAVQQQPIIINIDATSPEFVQYFGGVFDSPSCYANGVNHAVLLVGFDLSSAVPYWIVRNSWGTDWGESGYMRLAIAGGDGVCGVNVLPGFYPVVKKASDVCNKVNFGVSLLGNFQGSPGTVNPCGRYGCVASGTKSTCACKAPFKAIPTRDGTQTCVLESACSFFPTNPCGVGTCTDTSTGKYTCICPFGYGLTASTIDLSPTCAPAPVVPGAQYYDIPEGTSIDCSVVYAVYGLSREDFEAQNPEIDCSTAVPEGTKLNVTSTLGSCALPYVVNEGDSAEHIEATFGISALCGSSSPNPAVNCDNLVSGQQVCIVRGVAPDVPMCTFPRVLQLSSDGTAVESCASIISAFFEEDAFKFFSLNPGFYCDRLTAPALIQNTPPLQTICLEAVAMGSILKQCYLGKYALARAGDTCRKIYSTYFKGSATFYKLANRNTACSDNKLYVGFRFCTKWR